MIATIGPEQDSGIVLSSHTDVAPVAGQTWRRKPFQISEFDKPLYGRGTSDMRGFIACFLAVVPDLVQRNLSVPVHCALSYDGEVGCLAARPLLDRFMGTYPCPLLCIVEKPSETKVAHAHRDNITYLTTITGKSGHSSMSRFGINAINYAVECLIFLRSLAAK